MRRSTQLQAGPFGTAPGHPDLVLSGGVGLSALEMSAPPPAPTNHSLSAEDPLIVRLRVLYDGIRQEPVPDHLLALTLRLT